MPSLPETFLNLTLDEFPQPLQIITLCETTKLRVAINTLLERGVSSCPVLKKDAPKDSIHKDSFMGMIDIIDIVAFFLEINNTTKNWDRGFEAVFETVVQFTDHTVGDIIAKNSSTLRHAAVSTNTTIQHSLELLGPKKTHRLLVLDKDGNLVNIVTQSRMLSYVLETLGTNHDAKEVFDMPLGSIVLNITDSNGVTQREPLVNKGKGIFSVNASSRAVEAFKIIHTKRVTGVAVVDDQSGNLIGNISSRDIRSLVAKSENFENLYSTCKEYLYLIKRERELIAREVNETPQDSMSQTSTSTSCDQHNYTYHMINTQSKLPPILTVSTDDSVGYVMFCLKENFIRRVYLTNGKLYNGKIVHIPASIVTLSDLMQILAGKAQ